MSRVTRQEERQVVRPPHLRAVEGRLENEHDLARVDEWRAALAVLLRREGGVPSQTHDDARV